LKGFRKYNGESSIVLHDKTQTSRDDMAFLHW